MSQKSPDPSRDVAGTDASESSVADCNDPTSPDGLPAVSRNIELAAEAARVARPVVSFARTERRSENDRATLPPPVPMEQLVEHMMLADSDRAPPPDIKPIIFASSADSIPPPRSDVDTVRTRMADLNRVPMSPTPPAPLQDEIPTVAPYADDADTMPPSAHLGDDTEPGVGDFVRPDLLATASVTARAIDAAEAVFEELGVEFFKGRSSTKDVSPDEPHRPRPLDEPHRPKPHEERWRPVPGSRLTPTRTMRPVADAIPPSSSSTRPTVQRRRASEPQFRLDAPASNDRAPASTGLSTSDRLFDVRERYERGDHRGALRIAETILIEQPDHLAALGYAESSRQMLRQKYIGRIGDLTVVPRRKTVSIELARLGFDARDVHIVDSIDGILSIDGIIAASGLPTLDVLRVLHDLVVDGLIEFGVSTGHR